MDFMFWVWIGIIVATALIEFLTLDLTSIWFTVGAIVPMILSIIGGIRWEIQVAVFIVLSIVLILSLRKVTRKFLLRNAKEKTNLDSLVGKVYKLIDPIDGDDTGTIKVNGVVWNVKSVNSISIEKGEKVKIVKVEGNKFIVDKFVDSEEK